MFSQLPGKYPRAVFLKVDVVSASYKRDLIMICLITVPATVITLANSKDRKSFSFSL